MNRIDDVFDRRQHFVERDLRTGEQTHIQVEHVTIIQAPQTHKRSLIQLAIETAIWFTIVSSLLARLFG